MTRGRPSPQLPPPRHYLVLPWGWDASLALPDHLRCTYELILSLAYDHDGRRTHPVTRWQLAQWRGLAVRTIDDHLAALRERALLASEDDGRGRGLSWIPLRLPEAPNDDNHGQGDAYAAADQAPAVHRSPSTHGRSPRSPERRTRRGSSTADRGGVPQAGALRGLPQHNGPLLEEEACLSQTPEDDLPSSTQEPHIGRDDPHVTECVERLEDAGVYAGLSQQIAGLPWVTSDLIDAWVWQLKQQRRVRSLGAVLASVLRDRGRCFPAPALPSTEELPEARDQLLPLSSARPEPTLPFDWTEWIASLREAIGDRPVDLWLEEAYPVSHSDGVLVVAVTTPFGVDWLSNQRQRELDASASELAGTGVKVRLVTAHVRGP